MDQPGTGMGEHPEAPERLQDLIRRRKKELRLTGDDLARLSAASGYDMSRHKWQRLMGEWPARTPEIPLDCIAEVLKVTRREAWDAAGRSLGVSTVALPAEDPHMEAVAAILGGHTDKERAGLIEVMRSASSVVGAVAPPRSSTQSGSA